MNCRKMKYRLHFHEIRKIFSFFRELKMTDNFLQEIDEDVRVEKVLKFWHTYRNHIIGGLIGIAVVYGGYTFWRHWSHQSQLEISQQLMNMMTDYKEGKDEEAEVIYEKIKNKKGYGALAQLLKATHLGTVLDKQDDAVKIYKELSEESSQDKNFRNLAEILEALHLTDARKLDETREILDKISKESTNPWHGMAIELSAIVEIKKGNKEKGLELLSKLADDASVSDAVRVRANALREQFSK